MDLYTYCIHSSEVLVEEIKEDLLISQLHSLNKVCVVVVEVVCYLLKHLHTNTMIKRPY